MTARRGEEILQLARYQVFPESVGKVLAAIREVVAYVRTSEPGTLLYDVWQDADNPAHFVHLCVYRDAEADRIHTESAEVRKFVSTIYPECLARIEFIDYKRVASKDDSGASS